MHSFIIQISNQPVAEDNRISVFDLCSDLLLQSRADYFGEDMECDRPRAVESLRNLLEGIASVSDDGTITVPEDGTAGRAAYEGWLRDVVDSVLAPGGTASGSRLAYMLRDFRLCPIIIALCTEEDGMICGPVCLDSAEFVERLVDGKTSSRLYVGSVLDYHC